jgi:RNA polymerase sigma factor (TIGR02999 family)
MEHPTPPELTQLLRRAAEGGEEARRALWTAIYHELRAIARGELGGKPDTMQPTALVHEAYFRLFGREKAEWANRRQFFAAAARAMRQIRVDDVRKKKRKKRGGDAVRVELAFDPSADTQNPAELLAVHDALDKLEKLDPRKAEVVMLRYYVGLTVDECAEAMDVSPRTVDSDWQFARIWLRRELSEDRGQPRA